MSALPRDQRAGRRQPPENEVEMSHDHWPHEEDGQAPAEETATKNTFWTLRRKPVSDEEFVEQLRKSSDPARLWRWRALLFIVLIVLVFKALQAPLPAMPAGRVFNLRELKFYVVCTGVVCLFFGLRIGHWFHGAVQEFWGDRRTDLLLHYHDILSQHDLLSQPPTRQQTDNHM